MCSIYYSMYDENAHTCLYTKYRPPTCLRAIRSHDLDTLIRLHEEQKDVEWSPKLCREAALRGYVDCLAYLYKSGCPWDQTTCSGAASGFVDCLRFAHERGCPWDMETTRTAASCGSMECLRYAIEHGCPIDIYAYNAAFRNGHWALADYIKSCLSQQLPPYHVIHTPNKSH